jgi:hypothetical protein
MPLNATEKFVYDICRTSFLSLWSYANPQGESAGKELCDVLVICDPDVIFFSVKEIKVDRNASAEVQFERWTRKAIEASARQLYGAERWINSSGQMNVVRSDGSLGVPFPPRDRRRIHRVAIALGGEERFPLTFGDLGKGFVHVFDERGCDTSSMNSTRSAISSPTCKRRRNSSGRMMSFVPAKRICLLST